VYLHARAKLHNASLPSIPPHEGGPPRLVADWYGRALRSGPAAVERAIAPRPDSTEDARWDALLAGLTAQLCLEQGRQCPRWALASDRYLATWWFMSPHASLHPSAFVEAPVALANHGVFIHRADLESLWVPCCRAARSSACSMRSTRSSRGEAIEAVHTTVAQLHEAVERRRRPAEGGERLRGEIERPDGLSVAGRAAEDEPNERLSALGAEVAVQDGYRAEDQGVRDTDVLARIVAAAG
jgi:hypothetical protein